MAGTAKRPPPEPLFISVKEAAMVLGISRNYMYSLLDMGLIESRYMGRRRLVLLSSLHDFVASLPEVRP
jgi:excisionase family DNA binding protein